MTVITMHERNRKLFESYYPDEVFSDGQYREQFHEDGTMEMSAVHGQFFLVIKTVKKVEDEATFVTPHETMLMDKMFYLVNLVEIGPVHDRVIPTHDPYVKSDLMLCMHNANKWAAATFKRATKHLLYIQDVQAYILKIVKLAEEAEEKMEDRTHYQWQFSHSFSSNHKLPGNEGAGIKTVIQISVRAIETNKF